MLKYRNLKNNLDDVALGLDSSFAMKKLFLRDAYYQYDYAMYKLPVKLENLSVSRAQLRELSKEVRLKLVYFRLVLIGCTPHNVSS